ncbi:1469_t:CDS:2, partial [Rhizophagus irregularis]
LALAIQMNDYDNYKSPYNFPYVDELQTSSSWWLGCKQSNHYLQELALYILSIVPHSASYIELEEVDHGDLEFSVDDILANVNRLN